MSSTLQQLDIFVLRPLITNFNSKLSTVTEYDTHQQLLCLISEENDIVLRYTSESGQEVLKLISWFRRTNRIIHDICFDPSGTWLLVLCFDNTLHIVPALAVVDKTYSNGAANTNNATTTTTDSNVYQLPFSTSQVTSYIIPFVGPHECPDCKKCPNHQIKKPNIFEDDTVASVNIRQGNNAEVGEENNQGEEAENNKVVNIENISQDVPPEMLMISSVAAASQGNQLEDKTGKSQLLGTSFMASNTCPYPLSVVWWRTLDGLHRAIIGYSDGSICFVGLSPNCPFVANTAIENGSVVKLFICRDNTFDSVMLMITSSLKQQYKLLLEQRVIKYMYPGEISPTPIQWDNEWQIVMPLKRSSNNSTDSNDVLDGNAVNSDRNDNGSESKADAACTTISHNYEDAALTQTNCNQSLMDDPQLQLPPLAAPPLYTAKSTNRSLDATASDSKTQVQFFNDTAGGPIDETNGKAGILPAARARLASLKSLGSKKLNAIKMRLSDNRQKLEECMPEHNLSSFAIMDSPSQTPELLTDSEMSFYSLQNLRNTFLLSALHNRSNSLSVHNIDANLKTLFQYKIPHECVDILISSNILYAIQYVDIEGGEGDLYAVKCNENSEKETCDTVAEKQSVRMGELVLDFSTEQVLDGLMKDVFQIENTADTSGATTTVNTEHCSPETKSPNSNSINAVGVISSAMASSRNKDDDKFNAASLLALFRFENETVLSLYQMATYACAANGNEDATKNQQNKPIDYKGIRSPLDYVQFYENADPGQENFSLYQMEIMKNEFPKINYDPCYVITNKNVYYIQLKKEPFATFLEAALAGEWLQCRQFCNTFDLNYESCIEFAGDYLLRRRKVTQALITYNTARIKPIRTALKLAMFSQTNALIHLCALALKLSYVLKSKRFCHPIINTLLPDITYRHSEDVRAILPPTPAMYAAKGVTVNEGLPCSDYKYGVDECLTNPQISPSSQFHLANLLLIALAEKAVNDKNYIPLWNFLVTNGKYHTNMTSIVLCQSGLFSAAVVLAKMRGVCIDTFLALATVVGQEFGWYTELNVCLYNLSDNIFAETIAYVPPTAIDYFTFIQNKLAHIRPSVLKRLEQQLNPFSATWRPLVSHTSTVQQSNESDAQLFEFCKSLIETYLAVLIHLESQQVKYRDNIVNALHTFRLTYEDNQFAIESSRFKPISAGCSHCACIVNGVAYFWGTNGVPCNYSVSKCADPPEPNHSVKSLDLLNQLNLEVHAVRCGRQHTLVLTNNGLYSFGNNNLLQLGIGRQMQAALQPMLIKVLDGKNITMLEAGQYHNAVVADGLLYTWGWGVYGQLGHGTIENVAEPQVVSFFRKKKIVQVSLGHAHSLVLCGDERNNENELYVFGSHHFGQLGLGASWMDAKDKLDQLDGNASPACFAQVKCVLPQKLEFTTTRIRLIHTKFFTNLAVDENECLYTWGSSPQALRLANQIKRRANAKLKSEESQRREMNKWFPTAAVAVNENPPILAKAAESTITPSAELPQSKIAANLSEVIADTTTKTVVPLPEDEEVGKIEALSQVSLLPKTNGPEKITSNATTPKAIDNVIVTKTTATFGSDVKANGVLEQKSVLNENQEEDNIVEPLVEANKVSGTAATATEADSCLHMTPQLVDTSEIAGDILQLSTGLFHYALISSSRTLYTWGKNLEHQLGTEDKERRAVTKPSPLDNIEQPMYVECGADFTLVMTTDYIVKAFGGNSNGQCGRELGASLDKLNKRLICMPASKRFMRYESQCVEVPVEINLPRPRIRLDSEPVRYLKSIPTYQPHFLQEADINFEVNCNYGAATVSPSTPQHYKSTTVTANSSDNVLICQDSDDLISSLENLSQNDVSSLELPFNMPLLETSGDNDGDDGDDVTEANSGSSSAEQSPEQQNYIRLPCTSEKEMTSSRFPYNGSCGDLERLPLPTSASNTTTLATTTSSAIDEKLAASQDEYLGDVVQQLRLYIHYCLYIFHGLYNPNKIREFSVDRLEYRIRTLMLNFKFIDAFILCLQDVRTSAHALKVFEYFAKDTGYVPLHRAHLRYLIYHLLTHYIEHKYDLLECENFLLNDLDYYLFELAYVLYFNNNNTVLEHNLNEKFKHLIAQSGDDYQLQQQQQQQQTLNDEMEASTYVLNETDSIFDSLSVKFKTLVCQRLLKHCDS